ncbi:chromate transporter [Halobacteriovorax sp. HLS]|uniref:chromate transporter n=1 Tax=Halobacteriovorax sp. HLS TaxID=2234000 RepID=UPI000FD8C0CA|nr:chromate transporter [Halobacteriovorax sp. HLS]
MSSVGNLKEIGSLFFRLGLVAFGGPAAHIAIVHKEVVVKRKWMDESHFLDLMGATALIPGPNSTEMVLHCGHHRGGLRGLVLAGVSFILPACILSGLLAYLYTEAVKIPNFSDYMIGVKPVVLILIFQALKKLAPKAIKNYSLAFVTLITFALCFIGVNEFISLLVGGSIGLILGLYKGDTRVKSFPLLSIFYIFTKIGAILFGSGYVLITYLQKELVENRGWLTNSEIADAIAIGQFTPGPVLSTSTFIGYLLGNSTGALVATVGIFLPSFVFVYFLNPYIPKLRDSLKFSLLLDGVNAASMGLMAFALYPLGRISFLHPGALIIFLVTLILTWKVPKLSTVYLVSISILLGSILTFFNIGQQWP